MEMIDPPHMHARLHVHTRYAPYALVAVIRAVPRDACWWLVCLNDIVWEEKGEREQYEDI